VTSDDRPVQVLLVEDNASDVRLTREAMRETTARCELNVVGDGVDALSYLYGEPPFTGRIRPDFVMLDLNLPRKGGREVLARMREDSSLRHIPVTVLSTSTAETDVAAAYGLGANCYIVKPVDFNQFREVIAIIDRFWFGVVRLPVPLGSSA
jgi:two-component system, chemotaxis family, response regulator Rcp1